MKISQRIRSFFQYHWTSEIYSHGYALRMQGFYPSFLPIFLTSDHGVDLQFAIPEGVEDLQRKYKSKHLTWLPASLISKQKTIKSSRLISITHPWVPFLRKPEEVEAKNKVGTVFFPIHSVPSWDIQGLRDEDSILHLKSLPERLQPIVVCLHMHDWDSSRHKLFLENNFEVVTPGDTSSPQFMSAFIEVISKYKYAISESWGSQVAFVTRMGIPCQILPRKIEIRSEKNGRQILTSEYSKTLQYAESLFSELPMKITNAQIEFVNKYLGLEFKTSRIRYSSILWKEFIKVGPIWFMKSGFKQIYHRIFQRRLTI